MKVGKKMTRTISIEIYSISMSRNECKKFIKNIENIDRKLYDLGLLSYNHDADSKYIKLLMYDDGTINISDIEYLVSHCLCPLGKEFLIKNKFITMGVSISFARFSNPFCTDEEMNEHHTEQIQKKFNKNGN